MEYLLIFLIALLIGSFLNVCIYRIPKKESIVFPSSHCTKCAAILKWIDLLPLVSYVLLKGKCRYCGEKISPRYPLVELINGFLWLGLFLKFGISMLFIKFAILTSLLIVIGFIDFKYQIIPDSLNLLGLIFGILFLFILGFQETFLNNFLGFLIGGSLFLLIAFVSGGAMGGGDIKLMAVLGFWMGWKKILLISLLSFVIGSMVSIILLLLKIKGRKDTIPFGPFIAVAVYISLVFGEEIIKAYWKLTLFFVVIN